MTRCPAETWLTKGHRYEARYSYGPPTVTRAQGGAVSTVPQIIESSKPRTYVMDICTRCSSIKGVPSGESSP